jgi:hypothetical protein
VGSIGQRLVEREQEQAGGQAKGQAGRKAGIHVERQGYICPRWAGQGTGREKCGDKE